MIQTDDIRASVAAGILNEKQAAALTALAHSRKGAREGLAPGDEPFELFKGFNEIFIITGLIILSIGWVGMVVAFFGEQIINYREAAFNYGLPTAVVIWLLSEYFIWRRRMVGPAIFLSILFAINAGITLISYFAEPFMVAQQDYSSIPLPLFLSTGAVFLFWLRFRVPFAMAMIAMSLFSTAMILAAIQRGTPESPADLFLLSSEGPFAWITLGLGLAIFAAAMAFDMSDPHRVTRRCANGFWLHVVAAPGACRGSRGFCFHCDHHRPSVVSDSGDRLCRGARGHAVWRRRDIHNHFGAWDHPAFAGGVLGKDPGASAAHAAGIYSAGQATACSALVGNFA